MLYNKQDKRAPIIQFFKQSLKGNLRSLKVTRHVDDISSDISSVSIESGTIDNKIQEISQKPKQNKLTLEFKMPKSEKLKLATEKNIVGMAKYGNPLMKTVIKAEEYTSNFDKNWDKLTNKAPVSLRTEKEVIYEKGPRKNVYSKVVSAPFKKEDKDETRAVPAKINTVQKFRSIHVKTGKTVEKELTKVYLFYILFVIYQLKKRLLRSVDVLVYRTWSRSRTAMSYRIIYDFWLVWSLK